MTDFPANLTLGQTTLYPDAYQPDLLCFIPRQQKRDELGLLPESELPFQGVDIWTAYELSWLNSKGKPCVAILELQVPAASRAIVESKSLKLYLNSLNQHRFESQQMLLETIRQDLSVGLGEGIQLQLYSFAEFETQYHYGHHSIDSQCLDDLDISVSQYQYDPQLLQANEAQIVCECLHSHLLKSNCLITHQPDWASVWIQYQGPRIEREALLRYLITFRDHNEFHEQCIERIFMDIMQYCQPTRLTVYARYVRRGGIDINPLRSNDPDLSLSQWLFALGRQ